ncbi:MAG: GNAT family N-acetyltransferase [Candidatus Bathyarchaeia archaeon]
MSRTVMDLKIVAFTREDAASLVMLLNEEYANSYEFIPYTVEKLLKEIEERNLTVLVAKRDSEILGCIALHAGHHGEHIEWLTSSKGVHQQVVEEMLVSEVEKRIVGSDLSVRVDADSPKMRFWIERGYKAEDGFYHMVARLDGVKPLPPVPEGAVIRSLKLNEERALIETVNTGYGWERLREGFIAQWKAEHPPFDESWIHIAEIGGKIVSAVASRPDTEYNKHFKARRGYLGPAVTLPEYRGRNLASALTRRAMNFLYEKGMDSVALHTAEKNTPSVTLLKNLGFEVKHIWKFMHKNIVKINTF